MWRKHPLSGQFDAGFSPAWPNSSRTRRATALGLFGGGLALLAGLGTVLDWREITPSFASLLYALLAVWAEAVLVPPRYAGWPSRLFPIVTLILIGAAPAYVVPSVLLALAVRVARRRLGQPERWPWATLALEVGVWLAAGATGVLAVEITERALQQTTLWASLFRSSIGEPGKLVLSFVWASSFVLASSAAGYSWEEQVLPLRLRRAFVRAVLSSIVVYAVVALCDATLTVYGPPVVSVLVALGLAGIAWREGRRRRQQMLLADLAALVEAKDAYTGQHLSDVAQRTALTAAELDLSARQIEDLSEGALLHDLGKLAVSQRVLTKPGTLDPEEWREVRAHTTVGRDLLRVLPDLATAAAIAGHHHERWDGRGYPDGLAGEQIPLAARIVCVVDAFDAMTTDRPYHQATSQDRAFAELEQQRGSQFDPDIVAAFTRAMQRPVRPPRWQCFAPLEE